MLKRSKRLSSRKTKKVPGVKKKILTKAKMKKKVWTVFSKFIRLRDCIKTTQTRGRGVCITCNKEFDMRDLHAGHFVPGRAEPILFDETCVHAQCFICNLYGSGKVLEYRRKIVGMYGYTYDEELEARAVNGFKYTMHDLDEMLVHYKHKVKELEDD